MKRLNFFSRQLKETWPEKSKNRDNFNAEFGRDIVAGRNIGQQARAAAERGSGTPTTLRDMYRDITANPRDSATLFEELSNRYAFKELKKVVDFLLHSLGADLKSNGPSIPRGLLHRLLEETRSLQADFRRLPLFQIAHAPLVNSQFEREGMERLCKSPLKTWPSNSWASLQNVIRQQESAAAGRKTGHRKMADR